MKPANKVSSNARLTRGLLVLLAIIATPAIIAAQATKVSSTEGRYTVIFPAPAERLTQPPKTVNGLTFAIETYRAVTDGQILMTLFTSYTGGVIDTQRELQMNVDNFFKSSKGTPGTTKPIEYVSAAKRIAGVDFTGKGPNDQYDVHGRFYVAGNDVWGIIYVAGPNRGSAAVKEQFFRSLEINTTAAVRGEHQ